MSATQMETASSASLTVYDGSCKATSTPVENQNRLTRLSNNQNALVTESCNHASCILFSCKIHL